jgi:hypothetical protein
MKKKCLSLLALSLLASSAVAGSYNVSGKVFYLDNGQEAAVANAKVSVGGNSVVTDEAGNYTISVNEGGTVTFSVKCPYSTSLVAPSNYSVDVNGDTTVDLQVVKGVQKQSTQNEIYLTETFDSWETAALTYVELPDNWGYLDNSNSLEGDISVCGTSRYVHSSKGKCLMGPTSGYQPMIIFPVKGDDDYGVDISFYARKYNASYNAGIELFLASKSDGEFTYDPTCIGRVEAGDLSTTYKQFTIHLDNDVVDGSDNQYVAIKLISKNLLDDLTVYYKSCYVEPITESLSGTVTSGGDPVADATVSLEGDIDGIDYSFTTETDSDGNYSIDNLLANINYNVNVVGPSFGYKESDDVIFVDSDSQTPYDVDLDYVDESQITCTVILHPISTGGPAAASADEDVTLEFYHDGELMDEQSVALAHDDNISFTVDGSYSPQDCAIRASVDGYYQTEVAVSSNYDGIQSADVDRTIDNQRNVVIHLQQQDTKISFEGGTLLGVTTGTTAYFTVYFEGHKLSLNSSDERVTLNLKNSASKAPNGLRTASTWSASTVPMKIADIGDGSLYVYKDMEYAWDIELETPNTYTLSLPAGLVNIDEYEYDHDLSYDQEFGVETGVMSVAADADELVDVYTPSGLCVKRGITRKEVDNLPSGIYIVK